MDLADRYLKGVAGLLESPGRTIKTLVRTGDPTRTITEVARAGRVDMVVMATHARAGLARLVLGSTAREVLQRARALLLLIRPDDSVHRRGSNYRIFVPSIE